MCLGNEKTHSYFPYSALEYFDVSVVKVAAITMVQNKLIPISTEEVIHVYFTFCLLQYSGALFTTREIPDASSSQNSLGENIYYSCTLMDRCIEFTSFAD